MRIGELSSATGVDIETIRFYEREGLLRHPERTSSRYRSYQASDVKELKFIRHCRSLDISLAEIRRLQNFRRHPELACAEINMLVDSHIELVQKRIQQLYELERDLVTLRRSCGEERTADQCGILQSLSSSI